MTLFLHPLIQRDGRGSDMIGQAVVSQDREEGGDEASS